MCDSCEKEQVTSYYKIDEYNCSHDVAYQKISKLVEWEMLDN